MYPGVGHAEAAAVTPAVLNRSRRVSSAVVFLPLLAMRLHPPAGVAAGLAIQDAGFLLVESAWCASDLLAATWSGMWPDSAIISSWLVILSGVAELDDPAVEG